MYIKGNFVPPDFMLPKEILYRSTAFQHAITPFSQRNDEEESTYSLINNEHCIIYNITMTLLF
eukprot:14031639-Ditylum_brightwellii.AAC.1